MQIENQKRNENVEDWKRKESKKDVNEIFTSLIRVR